MSKITIKLDPSNIKISSPKEKVNLLRHTSIITYQEETKTYDEWVKCMRPFGYSSMLSKAKEMVLKEIGMSYPELMDQVLDQLSRKINV